MNLIGFGTTRIDVYLYTPLHAEYSGEVKLEGMRFNIGGSVLNTCLILHYIGANITFYTHLGNDEFGMLAQSELKKIGLNFINASHSYKERTATTFILVDKTGERTMYSYDDEDGINFRMKNTFINEAVNFDGFFTSCYEFNKSNIKSLKRILKKFNDLNKPTFLDLSPLVKNIEEEVWNEALLHFSTVIGTEDEFKELMSIIKIESFEELKERYNINKVYVKMGDNGSKVIIDGIKEYIGKIKPVNSKNVTCCGDTYNAGVIWGEINNEIETDIVKNSNILAGQVAKYGFVPKKVVKRFYDISNKKFISSKKEDYIKASLNTVKSDLNFGAFIKCEE